MKIYISVDIEGICGTTAWSEVSLGNAEYPEFQRQMTREVTAACEGAFDAGATEILIKDAHADGRNIIAAELPRNTRLIRGWSRHPYMMMQELDSSFDAALMLGYHSPGGSGGNPLAHTMSHSRISLVTINGNLAAEFLINCYTAILEKVPVVFVSGDRELCEYAAEIVPGIGTVAVKTGAGASTTNMHPDTACESIKSTIGKTLSRPLPDHLPAMPEHFKVTIAYNHFEEAYKASFFPGAALISARVVGFESDCYFEVLRFFLFTL